MPPASPLRDAPSARRRSAARRSLRKPRVQKLAAAELPPERRSARLAAGIASLTS